MTSGTIFLTHSFYQSMTYNEDLATSVGIASAIKQGEEELKNNVQDPLTRKIVASNMRKKIAPEVENLALTSEEVEALVVQLKKLGLMNKHFTHHNFNLMVEERFDYDYHDKEYEAILKELEAKEMQVSLCRLRAAGFREQMRADGRAVKKPETRRIVISNFGHAKNIVESNTTEIKLENL